MWNVICSVMALGLWRVPPRLGKSLALGSQLIYDPFLPPEKCKGSISWETIEPHFPLSLQSHAFLIFTKLFQLFSATQ